MPNSRVSQLSKSAKYADKTLAMEETLNEMFQTAEIRRKST